MEPLTPERQAELESHSVMLGQISAYVERWCIADEVTTLDAVRLALCDLEELRAKATRQEIEQRYTC